MEIIKHESGGKKIAELEADEILINSAEDALGFLGHLYYDGFDCIILHTKHLNPGFFDLKSGMAGEILQKFSNYRMGLAIVGDLNLYSSKSIRDFISESNRTGLVYFVPSAKKALERLSQSL